MLPTAAKVEFIGRAVAAGLRRIEVTSFVNPKRVPQMADAEALSRRCRDAAESSTSGSCSTATASSARAPPAATRSAWRWSPATRSTPQPGRRHARRSPPGSRSPPSARGGLRARHDLGGVRLPVRGRGRGRPAARVVEAVARCDPREIALADTIGAAGPRDVVARVGAVRARFPGIPLRCHFHNTRNTGLANAYAAIEAGVATLDASLGGIGGCPFAPRATGNIPTEDLVYMLHRSGVATGLDLGRCIAAAQWLETELEKPLPGQLMKAGAFPPA